MRILTKDQMCEMPVGTIFATWHPEIIGDIRVKTDDGSLLPFKGWNGSLFLEPFVHQDDNDETLYHTNWSTIDDSSCDYDDDQLFAVFSEQEVMQMVSLLLYGLANCSTKFDDAHWYADDGMAPIHENNVPEW